MQKVMMTSSRILLQEAGHHQRGDPCRSLHTSLHELGRALAQNASSPAGAGCEHAYAYVRRHHGGSPIPYLLAGLAAMLALIAISLFILACSYWKLVGCVEQHARAANYNTASVMQAGTAVPLPHSSSSSTANINGSLGADSKLVVIMAGHDKPTFLAQPVGLVLESSTMHPSSTATMKV
ncbi:hypothetical protein L7F22_013186 [Adiantum nelumboides]|nr:hypothetical protein [Adiantum nelumboides]